MEKTKIFGYCREWLRRQVMRNEANCKIFNLYCEPIYRIREKRFWEYKLSFGNKGIKTCFYKSEDSILRLIEADKCDEKWLIFIAQKKLGRLMYEQLIKKLGKIEMRQKYKMQIHNFPDAKILYH